MILFFNITNSRWIWGFNLNKLINHIVSCQSLARGEECLFCSATFAFVPQFRDRATPEDLAAESIRTNRIATVYIGIRPLAKYAESVRTYNDWPSYLRRWDGRRLPLRPIPALEPLLDDGDDGGGAAVIGVAIGIVGGIVPLLLDDDDDVPPSESSQ